MRSNLGNKYHKSRFGTPKQGFSEIITPMIIYYQHDDNFYQQGKIIWKKIFKLHLQVSIALKKRYSKISPCFKKLNLRFRKLILDFARLIFDFIFLKQRFWKLFLCLVVFNLECATYTQRRHNRQLVYSFGCYTVYVEEVVAIVDVGNA